MSENTPGPATDTGAQTVETAAHTLEPTQSTSPEPRPEPGSVPYSRFQEVVEQRKGLEATLNGILDGMISELPEEMRDLVPNLPPAEKVVWLRNAKERGLFAKKQDTQTSSPDAKRPGGKQPVDFSGLSPLQKMQAGYSQK